MKRILKAIGLGIILSPIVLFYATYLILEKTTNAIAQIIVNAFFIKAINK